MQRIVTNCSRCGKECIGRFAAMRHCQKPWPDGPFACDICGREYDRKRKAFTCCQQRGTQRGAGEGYNWRNYETIADAFKRRMDEVRADPYGMAEIRAVADAIVRRFNLDGAEE